MMLWQTRYVSTQPNGLIVLSYRAEPDLAFDMLRTLLQHRDKATDLPLPWGDRGWNQEEGHG